MPAIENMCDEYHYDSGTRSYPSTFPLLLLSPWSPPSFVDCANEPSVDGMVWIKGRKQLYNRGMDPWPATPVNALCLIMQWICCCRCWKMWTVRLRCDCWKYGIMTISGWKMHLILSRKSRNNLKRKSGRLKRTKSIIDNVDIHQIVVIEHCHCRWMST